ncbi:unnamed protein product [Owenia fusiformis]|uniref:Uncharacterized protein n=1 Tax=Owenia fusiformis TaxID=6347 RepID=A0A8S4PY20_OWEFU|nr:unnamed protein product [Owenia fusiformis]
MVLLSFISPSFCQPIFLKFRDEVIQYSSMANKALRHQFDTSESLLNKNISSCINYNITATYIICIFTDMVDMLSFASIGATGPIPCYVNLTFFIHCTNIIFS